jgi:glucokinase
MVQFCLVNKIIDVSDMRNIVLGVDIGGSHITAAVINLKNRALVENTWYRNRIDANGTASEILNGWANTIRQCMAAYHIKPAKIKIAIPGPMDYKTGTCLIKEQNKFRSLYGLNIKKLLAEEINFEAEKIIFLNDAACFLKGELYSGSLYGFDKAIGLTLGTGLGTSHMVRGKARDSDLWKMPFLTGIAEDYISTRWFVKRFYELSNGQITDVKDLIDNHSKSPYFNLIFREFSYNLAKFIYKFIKKKMPSAAVIGGNIALAEDYFMEETRKQLAEMMGYSFPVKKSTLGEKATLLGASASI